MGKLTLYTIKLVIASVFVWFITVLLFTDEIVFTQSEDPAANGQATAPPTTDLEDGVYTGSADGHNGPLTVDVTIQEGAISDIVITDHTESSGISDPALEEIPAAIVENNSTDVDTVSGATVSSRAIIAAVNNALGSDEENDTSASEDSGSTTVTEYTDGTYSATVEGHNGPIEVEVTVENGDISNVVILSHAETDGIADPALEGIPTAIVENNSTDVDVVSGATVVSEAIIEAVNTALQDAQ